MIIHVQPHWVRLQNTPMLQCSTEMQYHIPSSIAAIAIRHVMSGPGAVRGQPVQHDRWDSAKDKRHQRLPPWSNSIIASIREGTSALLLNWDGQTHTSRSRASKSKQSGCTRSTPPASLCDPWGGRWRKQKKGGEKSREWEAAIALRKGVETRLQETNKECLSISIWLWQKIDNSYFSWYPNSDY